MRQTSRLFLWLFLFPAILLRGQEPGATVSLQFSDLTLPEIFESLEAQEGVTIYYLSEWFDATTYSGDYRDLSLEELLATLLSGTELNLYGYEPRTFVLTRNNRIYGQLPPGFFTTGPQQAMPQRAAPVAAAPIFVPQEEAPAEGPVETVRIGKQVAGQEAESHTLSGTITDKKSGEPIPDVTVLVTDVGRGTTTDASGYFSLELPPGLHQLETRFIGMKSIRKRVVLYGDGQLNLQAEEGVQELEEVVVEARLERNVVEVTAGTDRIISEESKDIPLVLGERNVLQVAATLPGISSAGEGAIGLNVRGGRPDQNQFLLNSATVYNPTHFFGIFQALNPFVVESVDIYKGVIPVEFGGRLSSVFDIHTVAGDTLDLKGEGSVGPVTANLAFEIPMAKGRSSLVLGGRAAYSDWILRSLGDDRLSGDQASFYDLIGTYTDRIDADNRLRATAYYSKDRFSLTRDSLVGYSNRIASLEWNHLIGRRHSATLSLANSRYAYDLGYEGEGNTNFEFGYAIEETELKAWDRFRYNERHQFTFGLAAKYYRVNPGEVNPLGSSSDVEARGLPREQALESGLFIADRISLGERLEVDAGLRWSFFQALGPSTQREYPDGQPRSPGTAIDTLEFSSGEFVKTYNGPEIRASARYLLAPELSLRAGYNSMYQYIHTLSNTTTVSPIDTWKLSDYNIRPQRSRQVSLGVFKNIDEAHYELSLEGYYKWSEDVLDFKSGARLLLNDQVETEVVQGDGRAYGVEFLLRKNEGRLNGWLGYTWSRSQLRFDSPYPSEQINGGEFFASNYDRPHDLSLVANYRFTRRYSASLNFAYQTGRPVTYPIGQFVYNNAEYVLYSDRNRYRIPDYIRLDLGVNIEGNHKKEKLAHSFWTISVYNVLGRNNPYSVYFVTEGGEVKALQSSIFAVPIPSITYNFKF
jgi:hypothetical protein